MKKKSKLKEPIQSAINKCPSCGKGEVAKAVWKLGDFGYVFIKCPKCKTKLYCQPVTSLYFSVAS
jgi:ssDNA-binding Zn-finger/Zn-ribbon topoisomerase 1